MSVISVMRSCFAALLLFSALTFSMSALAAAKIQELQTPGGIKVWFVQERSIPILSMEVVWKGGASLDPADKAGLANLAASTMDEGAGDLDSRAFQKRLSDLAISLSFDASKDSFQGSVKTLSENKDEAFRLFSLALTKPQFAEEPVERIRSQILVSLSRKLSNPNSLAGRKWFETAFNGHPYSQPSEGTLETVKRVTQEDLVAFKNRQIAKDNMVISVVGDISSEELQALIDKTFGGIASKSNLKELSTVSPNMSEGVVVIDYDIPQSVVVFGGQGISRDDPDYYAAYVLNYILGGGGFESRLTEQIREKRGLVYSIYSYLYPLRYSGVHLGGFGTSNATVGQAVGLLKEELEKIRTEGVTEEELASAKTYLNGSFPLRLSSNSRIANIMASMQVHDLPVDYLENRANFINSVTLEDIKRVAGRLMDPENLLITVVGKPKGL
ncbi:MAG: insulinase family protein [Sneathiellales bacterium]|nr:insulinase family protein [Sneathiellales bacterium]